MSAITIDVIPPRRQKKHSQANTMSGKKRVAAISEPIFDRGFFITIVLLLCLGLVMVTSASITIADRQYGFPFYFLIRQALFLGIGLAAAIIVMQLHLDLWEKYSGWLFIAGSVSLLVVLIPGVGMEVNGSTRWLAFGSVHFQPSELMKLAVVLYVASYLVRRGNEVRTSVIGFLKPMFLMMLITILLLMEPDFGTAAIIVATTLGMMFIGGVRLWQFGVLLLLVIGSLAMLAWSSPYRLERLTTFLNPWEDPFNRGFQLTQALIAFGRGEWLGVGLGGSVQKLFYLPEAHTDFLFAVLAEELGLVGAMLVVGLFGYLIWCAFAIGRRCARTGNMFGTYLAYGLGLWIGMQAFINIGVNMGLLPTKGLTLPLMSYGGSSLVIMCIAVALLLRIDYETRKQEPIV